MTDRAHDHKCNLVWTSWWKKKFSDDLVPFAKKTENHHGHNSHE